MTAKAGDPKLEDLLQRTEWARRLARHLVHRREDADDLLQDAWLVASEKAAGGQAASRPWLAGVLRVLGMNQARLVGRRRQRETEAGAAEPADMPGSPEALLAQVETQRRLSGALLALAEPYRTTILLRYYEELSAADIARRTGVPAGTVRWRLKQGIERLRRQLGERSSDRAALAVALAKFAEGPVRQGFSPAVLAGALTAAAAIAGVAVVIVSLVGGSPANTPPQFNASKAPPAPGKDDDMNIRNAVVAAAALAAQAAASQAAAATPETMPASEVPRYQVPLGVGPMQGPATAKVTILGFLDYQSPFCLQASRTIEALMAAHPGQLRYQVIHRPLPFHRQAPYAARAAFAAGQQGKFWEMHATLLEHQAALEPSAIEGYARQLGLDVARFRADIDGPTVSNQAELEEANARSVNIAAVPTFFLNGRLVAGAQPRAVFEQALREELAHADQVLKAGVRPSELYTAITSRGSSQLPGPPATFGEQPGPGPGPGTPVFLATHKLLDDNLALANACFEEGRRLRADLTGKLVIKVKLTRGQPARVLMHESTLNFPKVDNCVVKALGKLDYPKLETEGPIVASRVFTVP